MQVKSTSIGFQKAIKPAETEESGNDNKIQSEPKIKKNIEARESIESDKFQRSIESDEIDEENNINIISDAKATANKKTEMISITKPDAGINTDVKRNDKVNYAGPTILGVLMGAFTGLIAAHFRNFRNMIKHENMMDGVAKQIGKVYGIGALAGAAIGATIYGLAASSAKANAQGYKLSKEEFANSKINNFRLITGLLRDDEVHNINKYGILPQNAKLPVVDSTKIYGISPDWFGFTLGTKEMPPGYEAKKNMLGHTAVYPKGTKGWLLK